MTGAVLEFHDVARSFGGRSAVLSGVTFSVAPNEVVALLGPNGAGKTTLIQIAMGMLYPHAGTVRAFGMSPTEHPVAVKRRIGYVSEDQVLPPTSTVGEMIAFHRRLFPTWDDLLERELLARFGLDAGRRKIGAMSKGEARQVALVCAACHRPELLVLDEPAGGLDPAARREVLETAIHLLNREGTAILFSSHHMSDVERLGGRVVLLDRGVVRLDDQLDALRDEYCVAVVSKSAVSDSRAIAALPGCLGVRAAFGDWRAVFRGPALECELRIASALGTRDVRCASVPLEELFIDLVGRERTMEAAS